MPPETPISSFTPLSELITRVMRIGRKCPDASSDVLEIMLLVSQIQAHVGVDHGYRHARRVIARLRHPLWDDLTEDELAVLNRAAGAIQRACKLDDAEIPDDKGGPPDDSVSRHILHDGLAAAMGDELSADQIERITARVAALLRQMA
jgi:hypothetical protein